VFANCHIFANGLLKRLGDHDAAGFVFVTTSFKQEFKGIKMGVNPPSTISWRQRSSKDTINKAAK